MMNKDFNSVELFSGAGGLAIGLANVGFHHEVFVEYNAHACATLRLNQEAGHPSVLDCEIYEGDARGYDFKSIIQPIDLVAGGPPCQPFSLGGKHKGYNDSRDMFPTAVRAVRELRPKAFIFENVKGLLRSSFADYLEYIKLQLSHPETVTRQGEEWSSHYARLIEHEKAGDAQGYKTKIVLLNAANHGVPQKRERIFIVGFRNDLDMEWCPPEPTHTQDALSWSKWVTGDYWREHGIEDAPLPTVAERTQIRKLTDKYGLFGPTELRWRTVRDAISNISVNAQNHEMREGARVYPGHTGSDLDKPSKTLKAGDHGVPGGENMLRYPNGDVRYFTARESARIQTFPDDYLISGSWTESMRQIGNAVPVGLAEAVGRSVMDQLVQVGKAASNGVKIEAHVYGYKAGEKPPAHSELAG